MFGHLADLSLQFDLQTLNSLSDLNDLRLGRLQGLSARSHLFVQCSGLWKQSINDVIDQISGYQTAAGCYLLNTPNSRSMHYCISRSNMKERCEVTIQPDS